MNVREHGERVRAAFEASDFSAPTRVIGVASIDERMIRNNPSQRAFEMVVVRTYLRLATRLDDEFIRPAWERLQAARQGSE